VTISANPALLGSYDYSEVARSVFIAMAASYAALDLTGRVAEARGRARLAWLGGGAVAMGIGIWEMHFKGMLAFHLPVSVAYHWPTVLASLLVAILASAFALYSASRRKMGPVEALTGSVIMGSGIAGMHYVGMAAMRLPATTRFSPLLVTCSILLAVLFSLIALHMAFGLREETKWTVRRRLGSAVVMGSAVSAMHYTGMAAATFIPAPLPELSRAVNISSLANNGIAIVTLIVIVAAMVTSSLDRVASAEIRRINEDLERRVAARTSQLEVVNLELRKEIAERERAQDAVRQSEDRLRLVIDTLPALVWSKSPDGSADFLNQRFREYTGLSEEEGLGWGWMRNAFHPEDRVEEEWRAAFAAGDPFEKEARLRRADGVYRWFLLRAAPLRDDQGQVVKWYGTTTDIEDRRRAEEALLGARDRLARVTRVQAMGELAAAIAHEVNQPLAAIVTNGNFCLRELAGGGRDLEKLREAIAEIVNDGTRASAIISRIRTLLTKGAPERTELDINEVIREATAFLRGELIRDRVSLRFDLAPDLRPLHGDRVQLQQIVLNLIMNGIDAMRTLTGRPRRIFITSAKRADGVLVQIEDSGPGIDPEQAERIFEPFFSTKPEGIGMGLSIARSIVESHGVRLWAGTGSNGALFEFLLPAH
jgi:PAS domain S-box-containing protein